MKNLLLYINPRHDFDDETKVLVKLQIDNSLELGWKPEDLLLVTNFPYEYRGIKAFQVGDENFNTIFPLATKVDAICTLFDQGFFQEELYWCHDFDAYQQEWINEEELGLEGYDIGGTDYGRHERWNGGSYWFRNTCGELFHDMKDWMYRENINEEDVLMKMTETNHKNFNQRIKRLNIAYNFGIRKMKICYEKALKPLKVLHFHPERIYWGKDRAIDIVYGKNEVGISMMNPRLTKLFTHYGWPNTRSK